MINSEPSSWQFKPPSESLRFRNVSPVKDLVLQHTTFLPLLSLIPSHTNTFRMGASLSRLWNLLWSKKEIRILILGLVR